MSIKNILNWLRLPFRKDKKLYVTLHNITGFYPNNIQYYRQALMHSSIGKREKGKPVNNERLEFLGDAILDAVVGHIVYRHFPGKREGFLTNTRSKLVSRNTLGRLAKEMGIIEMVQNDNRNNSHNSYMGGNAFEALVGAIYLDLGYDACMQFMEKKILKEIINIDKVAYKEVNFKSKLIEWGQKNRVQVEFVLLKMEKEDNGSPKFAYQISIEGIKGEKGEGYSKKEAQQQAAKLTLQRLRKEPQFTNQVFEAKTKRTKMEEEPVSVVPNLEEQPEDFIIGQPVKKQPENREEKTEDSVSLTTDMENDDYSLDDITVTPKEKSREEIIAAAEEAAFAE